MVRKMSLSKIKNIFRNISFSTFIPFFSFVKAPWKMAEIGIFTEVKRKAIVDNKKLVLDQNIINTNDFFIINNYPITTVNEVANLRKFENKEYEDKTSTIPGIMIVKNIFKLSIHYAFLCSDLCDNVFFYHPLVFPTYIIFIFLDIYVTKYIYGMSKYQKLVNYVYEKLEEYYNKK
jgi:hypothetical protein